LDVEPSSETRSLYQAVRTFSRCANPGESEAPAEPAAAKPDVLPYAGRLRVGVLPFRGEGSPRSESLALSLSQEIAAALARFRWFDVIAPISLVSMPSDTTSEDFLRRKNLHYLVGGSLSGDEEKFRISVRLLDVTHDARPVWSDCFELSVNALDRMNELITAPVAARIDPVILFIEGQPTRPPRSGATGLVLQAIPMLYSMERQRYHEARSLLDGALQIDPNNAMAAAWGAFWHLHYVGQVGPRTSANFPQRRGIWQSRQSALIQTMPRLSEFMATYVHLRTEILTPLFTTLTARCGLIPMLLLFGR
jgi:TolB-like protein